MHHNNRKEHWEHIYQTKQPNEVSWYQPKPETSLRFISQFNLTKTARIIDVGGGDSYLVDYLLQLGFSDITVLDISKNAIERAQKRLGDKAAQVNWVVADVTDFLPNGTYDLWHDRAVFHFLTKENEITQYQNTVQKHIAHKGGLIVGTFSTNGPDKCSGLPIMQYSQDSLTKVFQDNFERDMCFTVNHTTPFDTSQNFVFCSFTKK